MKKTLIIGAVVAVALIAALPFATRYFGPRMVYVPPPQGTPIGEYDVPRPETSILGVSIVVPVDTLSEIANEQIPAQFQGQDQANFHRRVQNSGYAWAAARGPITFVNSGRALAFSTPFSGAARFQGNVDAEVLTIPLDTTVEMAGTASGTLEPIVTPDWQVDPRLTPQLNLTNATLSLGLLGTIDISEFLGGALGQYLQAELADLAPALRRGIDLRGEVEPLWNEAFLNRLISDDPEVWVSVTPQQVLMAPLDYSVPEHVSLNVGIQSTTYLTNRDPGVSTPQPLPPLTPLQEPISTYIRLPIIVGMAELNEALKGENFDFDTGVGAQIEISGMEAEVGQGGRLNLKLNLQADQGRIGRGVSGEIWVTGRPIIDVEQQTLGFTDVELTVETRDKLTTAAAWLLEGILVRTLEAQLRVDLDDYKAEIDEEVQKALDSGDLPSGLEISLRDLSVGLGDIYTITRHFEGGLDDPGIVLVISATGNMETRINRDLFRKEPAPGAPPAPGVPPAPGTPGTQGVPPQPQGQAPPAQ